MSKIEKLKKEKKELQDLELQVKNVRSYAYYTISALNKIDCLVKDSNFVYQISLAIEKIKKLSNQWISEINTQQKYKEQELKQEIKNESK